MTDGKDPITNTRDIPSETDQKASPKAAAKKQTEYTHTVCETENKMSDEMMNRYYHSNDPVESLYCNHCGAGIRIGEDGEMVWTGTKDKVPVSAALE